MAWTKQTSASNSWNTINDKVASDDNQGWGLDEWGNSQWGSPNNNGTQWDLIIDKIVTWEKI